jgi:hypothetical protein
MISSNKNIEELKKSLVELKKRLHLHVESKNNFASQNKEYLPRLLKTVA